MFKIIEEKGSRYVVRADRTVEGLTKGVKKISLKKSDAEPVERLLEVPFCDNDELAHILQLADRFVDNPGKIVKVGQVVQVRVLEVDEKRKRVQLSMKKGSQGRL